MKAGYYAILATITLPWSTYIIVNLHYIGMVYVLALLETTPMFDNGTLVDTILDS